MEKFENESGLKTINTGPRAGTTQAASTESVSLRRLVDKARSPLFCGAVLEEISKTGPDRNPLGKYFNIELKSLVVQHENLAAKGILCVRISLRFFFSFRLKKNSLHDFFTDSSINSKAFDIKFATITASESI